MQNVLTRLLSVSVVIFMLATLVTLMACNNNNNDDDATPAEQRIGFFSDGELDKNLEAIRAKYNLPALAAFVVDGDGLLETTAVGERSKGSGVEVTSDDMWHLGSITKSMTATLAAVLVDEAVIRWDSTVAEVFPETADRMLEKYRGLQLQQLLSMTAGLTRDADNPVLNQLDPNDGTRAQRILGVPLVLSYDHELPIGEYLYSNTSYVVAAAMLEKSTNQDWQELLTTKVMSPLNIDEFGFGPPGTEGLLDQPLDHTLTNGEYHGVFQDLAPIIAPVGRVHMSLNDIAAYASFHLKGKSGESDLISQNVMQELYRGRTPENSEDLDSSESYALGWIVDMEEDFVYHNGSNGFWIALLVIDFRHDVAIFAVTNAAGTAALEAVYDTASFISDRVESTASGSQP